MAGAKVPLTFRIFKGDQLLREEKLSLSVIKLGKVPSAHLKLDDETVSRMHAIIEVNGPGDVSIIDLGSTKGTFVNNQKVNKAKLQSGDTIVVGETRIELSIGSAEEEGAAAPPPADAFSAPPSRPQSPSAPPPMANMTMPAAAPPPPMPPPMAARGGGTGPSPAMPFAPPPMMAPPPAMAPPVRPQPMAAPMGFGGGSPLASTSPFGAAVAAPSGFQQVMAGQVEEPGRTSVEIAAMLGDSVVGVKHCVDPTSGSVSGLTWALFAVGGLAVVGALVCFAIGAHHATDVREAHDYWVNVLHKPAYSLRVGELPFIITLGFWLGVVVGLGALTTAVSRARGETRSPYYRIGTNPEVEFPTESFGHGSFALVSPNGNDFSFNFANGMEGEMIYNGQTTPLSELAAQGRSHISPIPQNAKIRVRAGKTTFLVSSVPRPLDHGWGIQAFLKFLAVALVGGLAVGAVTGLFVGAMAVLSIYSESNVGLDIATTEDTSTRTNSTSQDDPPPPPPEDQKDDGKDESGGTGTAMALDEGKMGKKDSDRAEGQYQMKNNNADPQLARQQAIEQARNAGILGSTALQQGGAFASLTGTGDISSGFDSSDIYGGLLGNEAGEMNGGFGYGRSGFGPGGGGTGWGTIGTGRYGTIGHGSGTGNGYGVGGGRGGMRGRTAAVPTVSIGQPSANGDLDKAIIRRYIKRNIQKITYCYEKQLLAKPGLSGTVATQFFITPNGTVASASGAGVDPEVASCVADVIKGIEFPKPKGGGGVQVNYPFTFRPAGS
jgi:hypothetical protein